MCTVFILNFPSNLLILHDSDCCSGKEATPTGLTFSVVLLLPLFFSRAMNMKYKRTEKSRPVGVASLPLQQSASRKISRLLGKFNIKTVHISGKKTSHILRSVKDDLGLTSQGSMVFCVNVEKCIQPNLYLLFPDNSFSRIRCSISMVPERILFQLWLPHLLFFWIHCFFFRPQTKTMNRGFTVYA
jgi:hypothetical protein